MRSKEQRRRDIRSYLPLWLAIIGFAATGLGQGPYARSGWLLVAASDYKAQAGRVFVVDQAAGTVVRSRATGIEPDVVVDQSGTRAYVSYNDNEAAHRSVLETIDLTTGSVSNRVFDNAPWPSHGMAYTSRMALSGDGRWLYRYKAKNGEDGTEYFVQTFDTEEQAILPNTAPIPLCGAANLSAGPTRGVLYVTCAQSQDVRLLKIGEAGGLEVPALRLGLPGGERAPDHLVTFLSSSTGELTVVKGDGRFVRTDAALKSVRPAGAIDSTVRGVGPAAAPSASRTENANDWLVGRQVWRQTPVQARDGSHLYLLVAYGVDTRASRNEVAVLETDSLNRTQMIALKHPAVNITLSEDGKELYAVDTLNSALDVYDADSGRYVRSIQGVGPRPVMAVAIP